MRSTQHKQETTLTGSKYKVKVNTILALQKQFVNDRCTKAYLGVSLNNPLFWHQSFAWVINWMAQYAEQPYLLLGDLLNRWNERIFVSESLSICQEKSLEQGQRLLEMYAKELHENKFQILHWQQLQEQQEYKTSHAELIKAFSENSNFRDTLQVSAQHFIHGQIERGQKPIVSLQTAYELSIEYLMEELAVFLLLIRQGLNIQVYPGAQLPVLEYLKKPELLSLPAEFEKGVFIGLRVKKR